MHSSECRAQATLLSFSLRHTTHNEVDIAWFAESSAHAQQLGICTASDTLRNHEVVVARDQHSHCTSKPPGNSGTNLL